MVRPVETIRREMDSLNQATGALAAEFNRLYTSYLDSLGLALRRQVVMATYHLCTQIYPEGFLALSVGQREKLQRDIRHLGQQANTWLQHLLEPEAPDLTFLEADNSPSVTLKVSSLGEITLPGLFPDGEVTAMDRDSIRLSDDTEEGTVAEAPDGEETAGPLTEAAAPSELEANPDPELEADAELEASEATNADSDDDEAMPLPALLRSMVLAALAEEMGENFGDRLFTGDTMTPTQLAKQHMFLEQRIRSVLQRTSKQANHLLQAAQVIPNLPEAVLDAASETAVGPTRGRSVPNVLSVLVAMATDMADHLDDDELEPEAMDDAMDEAINGAIDEAMNGAMDEDDGEDNEEPREGMMTHLAAVNLRLSDVEFTDVQASLWRSKLRTALGHLRKLGKQYQKAQREMAIAEAEQAWRAVWYDDTPR